MSIDKNAEVKQFDNDEAENLGIYQNFASDAEVETARAIIADERKAVEAGDETADEGEDNVSDRIEATLDDSDSVCDDCGECGCA